MTLNTHNMKNDLQHQLKQIKDHVLDCFKQADTAIFLYHNKDHTISTAQSATMLADHYQLSDRDSAIIMAAVWFHDLGYLYVHENHETESARLAEKFLAKKNVDGADMAAVKSCIMATKIPQSASGLNEQIVCDADLFQLGTEDFFKNDKLLRKERIIFEKREISKQEWRQSTIEFLRQHTYYTDYCRLLLDEKKAQNLAALEEKISEKAIVDSDNTIVIKSEEQPMSVKAVSKAQKQKEKPEKGIETMFRISSGNHQRLSDMADKKAHIMITVNSIILSAIISLVLRRLDDYGFLAIPTFMLLAVSATAMTFSVLSTRPSVPRGVFSLSDLEQKKVNLLFFGNFYKMPLEQFTIGMKMMMEDGDFLYGSLIRDVYAQGVVLGKKYHLLRISYNVFMYGLIGAVIAFMLAYLLKGNVPTPPVATHVAAPVHTTS
jgi:predicted metal-dependent HD superfamily phosphohydrolase